eukprot:m.60616 g.60616  ORF g.60616 m.60616 type:complete len:666 (+) comp11338_c1_seq2:229-2226(+)
MATHRVSGKRMRLSYLLRPEEDRARHTAAVSSIKVDVQNGRVFTSSRDATIRKWDVTMKTPQCIATGESHTNWINDMEICPNINLVATASSDCTVKLWDKNLAKCVYTAREHSDYVTAIKYSPGSGVLFSAGLDKQLIALKVSGPSASSQSFESTDSSIYSLACNEAGTVLATGSTDKTVRLWDPRVGKTVGRLKGHTDVIKALEIDSNATYCLSGSSDCTLKMWDLRQQRCVSTYAMHEDSVWALCPNKAFKTVYSGGRDKRVYITDLANSTASEASVLVVEEEYPILNLEVTPDECDIWVSTTSSSVSKWPTFIESAKETLRNSVDSDMLDSQKGMPPLATSADCTILGGPSVVEFKLLEDGYRVITKDTDQNVRHWNLISGKVIKVIEDGDFESEVKAESLLRYVPKWCTLDNALGCLAIHLEKSNTFTASLYRSSITGGDVGQGDKINFGFEVVNGLLRKWLSAIKLSNSDENKSIEYTEEMLQSAEDQNSALFESFPTHIPILLTSMGDTWQNVLRCTTGDAHTPEFQETLKEEYPLWLHEALFTAGWFPDPIRIVFDLEPDLTDKATQLSKLQKSHLTCPAYLPIKKVAAHVVKELKISSLMQKDVTSDLVEVLCDDGESLLVLSPEYDLATVQHRISIKSPGRDLQLKYRRKVLKAEI